MHDYATRKRPLSATASPTLQFKRLPTLIGPAEAGQPHDDYMEPEPEPAFRDAPGHAQRLGQVPLYPAAPSAEVLRIASDGLAGSAGPLPHLEQIQQSFGPRHELGSVRAHLGAEAVRASRQMDAQAYACGEHVAFAIAPSLQVAAHEAAHVVQQRAGVQPDQASGGASDRYEQHADRVATEVVAGRSSEGMLGEVAGQGGTGGGSTVQFWGHQHKDFTGRAVDRWNKNHPEGTRENITANLKTHMVNCSDDADYTGRAFTMGRALALGPLLDDGLSDLAIYYDFIVGGKEKRRNEYAEADPEEKEKLFLAACKSVCASEGPTHGEGNRPSYGSGGSAVNHAYMMSQIEAASMWTFGGFMSLAGAGQLGDAMHCAQDRASHCEGNRSQGHDDVRDKLGIDGYDTDDPGKNLEGASRADSLSDVVLALFADLRRD